MGILFVAGNYISRGKPTRQQKKYNFHNGGNYKFINKTYTRDSVTERSSIQRHRSENPIHVSARRLYLSFVAN